MSVALKQNDASQLGGQQRRGATFVLLNLTGRGHDVGAVDRQRRGGVLERRMRVEGPQPLELGGECRPRHLELRLLHDSANVRRSPVSSPYNSVSGSSPDESTKSAVTSFANS